MRSSLPSSRTSRGSNKAAAVRREELSRARRVATDIDPKKSFWKDFVTYPFPVKYATVKDSNGTSWQIGYMDEYAGTDQQPAGAGRSFMARVRLPDTTAT